MNEPQSNTHAGPADAPDAAAAAVADAAPAEPAADASLGSELSGDVDTSEDTLADQVSRTDAALMQWRRDAEKRREAWLESKARAEAQMLAQRRRVMRIAALTGVLGLGLGFAAGVLFWRTWTAGDGVPKADLEPPATSTAPAPSDVTAPEEAPEPSGTPATAPAPAASPDEPVDILEGTARTWREGSHAWAAFDTTEGGSLSLRYLDAAGAPALEPMECQATGPDGVRHCSAGRSEARLAAAVAHGAAPGTWTVEACGAQGCVVVGTFDVPSA
ncbi:MAG: hypothetical protein R3F59_04390 [Myxococcota bacterium]